ncbi:ribosomal protein S18-alanine N-acetyltransferase [Thiomicrorhabdus indica]|uniref:ribosomal protein S18-alanine N-acetyltransferase n=1 Tax=Thiomicrorhabdus indica TaxID=2267253 RepID=UPI002AA8222F|nr:ribosomal protein S18-alanine N-acetyltransferase [Thiomicrorhabdus indica]
MSDFFVRAMSETDLPDVLAIERKAYAFPWSQKGFENALDQGLNFVFENPQKQIIGYGCFLTVLDEATLMNLCISPDYQGQGIAKSALKQLLEKLQDNFQFIYLEVRESNRPARNLYTKFGFSEDGIRKNYYPAWIKKDGVQTEGREDAVLMSKALSKS